MDKAEISTRVKNVIKSVLKIDGEVDDNANFIFDLGADSLQSIQLVAAFEEEFNIDMDEDEALKIQTVADSIEFIHPYVNN